MPRLGASFFDIINHPFNPLIIFIILNHLGQEHKHNETNKKKRCVPLGFDLPLLCFVIETNLYHVWGKSELNNKLHVQNRLEKINNNIFFRIAQTCKHHIKLKNSNNNQQFVRI